MDLNVSPLQFDLKSQAAKSMPKQVDPSAQPFSQSLNQAKQGIEAVPPAAFSFQSQFNTKKKRVESIEVELERLDEEESVYKTANELVEKLKSLAELERKHLGL